MHLTQKYILQLLFSLRLALNLFLIFQQNSGSCSYIIVLVKKVYKDTKFGRNTLNKTLCLTHFIIGKYTNFVSYSFSK